ncbi:putative AC transposase [Colletotrichum spaethianum]|uniref:AC transposase n=1 Tax=Colletotrichum spaethianum TaxID=700344 RepID=A0AA37ULT8_9PEZI|nr:putative AC transposase [Colletotrichum spaethianum]GKT52606.1 putative AC transposase [Colletotrichum spaethianum]
MAPALGPARPPSEASSSQQGQPNELDRLLDEMMVAEDVTRDVDDFENFIRTQPIKIEGSPLLWWCLRDQIRTYPRLSRMAIDILSVPPGSADPESAFSGGRRTLSWDRERMSCANLEKVECIGNWLREGLIIPSSRGGRGLVLDGEINGSVRVDSDDDLD